MRLLGILWRRRGRWSSGTGQSSLEVSHVIWPPLIVSRVLMDRPWAGGCGAAKLVGKQKHEHQEDNKAAEAKWVDGDRHAGTPFLVARTARAHDGLVGT